MGAVSLDMCVLPYNYRKTLEMLPKLMKSCEIMGSQVLVDQARHSLIRDMITRLQTQWPVARKLYHKLARFKTSNCSGQRSLASALPVRRTVSQGMGLYIKIAQHLDSRCVLLPAPWVGRVPAKTRLESRFCNKEDYAPYY